MGKSRKVLIAGESWVTHSIHQKGFDSFTTTSYEEGVGPLRAALDEAGFAIDYLPNHVAATDFPETADEPAQYVFRLPLRDEITGVRTGWPHLRELVEFPPVA